MYKRISCVYKVENIVNHKVYIGETGNFYKRRSDHISQINSGYHENPALNDDLLKYSKNDFIIEILEILPDDKKIRLCKETEYINRFGGIESDNVYNYKDKNRYNKLLLEHMSINRKNIPAWNKGLKDENRNTNKLNKKYTNMDFIEELCNDYVELKSYDKVAKKHNMQKGNVYRLIKNAFNTSQNVSTNPDECKGVE